LDGIWDNTSSIFIIVYAAHPSTKFVPLHRFAALQGGVVSSTAFRSEQKSREKKFHSFLYIDGADISAFSNMYKASQEALFQATNQQLVSIRQSEIQYYANVNIAIGTQAALIGGFTYGIFTQNQPREEYEYARRCLITYHITSGITIAAAVHVIINTMMLQVMGPGLALNGPVGSMARAADGMRKEQYQVTFAFTVMMIFFSISTTISFWAVMDREAAIVCTLIFGCAARMWYFYGRRVYNRLHWVDQDSFDNDSRETDVDPNEFVPINPLVANSKAIASPSTPDDERTKQDQPQSVGGMGMISRLFASRSAATKNIGEDTKSGDTTATSSSDSSNVGVTPFSINFKGILCEGYLLKCNFLKTDKVDSRKWERRYCILQNGFLFSYKTRQEYRDDPKKSLKERPLELQDFKIIMFNQNAKYPSPKDDDQKSVASSMSFLAGKSSEVKMVFQINLLPMDQLSSRWSFRCDTEEELENWTEALKQACPYCFENVESVVNE
jgi:hypothetical protein